jgi:hypothetical protein
MPLEGRLQGLGVMDAAYGHAAGGPDRRPDF